MNNGETLLLLLYFIMESVKLDYLLMFEIKCRKKLGLILSLKHMTVEELNEVNFDRLTTQENLRVDCEGVQHQRFN